MDAVEPPAPSGPFPTLVSQTFCSSFHPVRHDVGISLPLELVRKSKTPNIVVLLACLDARITPKMCLICTTVHSWVLPVLYHSLQFALVLRLISFVAKHDVPEEPIRMRLLLVRNLYIGSTPDEETHMVYLHHLVPCVALERLLSLCTELRSFTLIGTCWPRFESSLPPHLDEITVGPMHSSIGLRQRKPGPPIMYLTNIFTFSTDGEMEDIASYPTIKKVRRLCDANSMAPFWAVKQAFIAAHLQEYEIVICGTPDNTRFARSWAKETLIEMDVDSKVTLREAPLGPWINLVYQEFIDSRQRFIESQ